MASAAAWLFMRSAPSPNRFCIRSSHLGLPTRTSRGRYREDYLHNRAFVAGVTEIGVLDTSQSPPFWNQGSVGAVLGTDSLALNANTGILFVSADGSNQIIDTTQTGSLVALPFESHHFGFADDGVAFDISTNVLLETEELGTVLRR